jgi:hypothetical protein
MHKMSPAHRGRYPRRNTAFASSKYNREHALKTGHPVVDAIGEIHFEGRLVPHAWRRHALLRTPANRPYNVAIDLLADVVYWHRPTVYRDEQSGRVTHAAKKFEADRYRIDYAQWAEENGYTKRQAQDAAGFLNRQKICVVQVENYTTPAGWTIYNAVFITPIVSAIIALNENPGDLTQKTGTPIPKIRDTPHKNTRPVSHKRGTGITANRVSLTKPSAEISTENQHQDDAFEKITLTEAETSELISRLEGYRVEPTAASYLVSRYPDRVRHVVEYLAANPAQVAKLKSGAGARSMIEQPEKWGAVWEQPTEPARASKRATKERPAELLAAIEKVYQAQPANYREIIDKDKLGRVKYIEKYHADEIAEALRG